MLARPKFRYSIVKQLPFLRITLSIPGTSFSSFNEFTAFFDNGKERPGEALVLVLMEISAVLSVALKVSAAISCEVSGGADSWCSL